MPEDPTDQGKTKKLLDHIAALEAERDKFKKRDWTYQSIFDRMTDQLASERPAVATMPGTFAGVTFVIAYYDIPRQIERTLRSCSPEYQGVPKGEIEVIIVDNGSAEPLPSDLQERFPFVSQILRVDGYPSPVFALNEGIKAARFEMIGVMIDGAHLLSPGVVQNAREIWSLFANPVINVPQYILGFESQNLTPQTDAFQREETDLASLGWPKDGYSLFDYAVYPGENYMRSWMDAIETNCLITTRRVLDTCGAFDERYDEPGAGFANLEIFSRLIHQAENTYLTIPGEGTFHQDHRGVTTQRAPEERDRLVAEYRKTHLEVTGCDAVMNARSPFAFGKTRRLTQRIPTISHEFGKSRDRILKQLANIYVARVRAGMKDTYNPVLSVGGAPDERLARTPLAPLGRLPEAAARNGVKEKELGYLSCLKQVHDTVRPGLYFEIGIDTGSSLRLSKCPSIGVDPSYVISNELQAPTRLFRQTSDAFFAETERCRTLFGDGIDLAFIDGMHLAEFVVRDFIETEKWMKPDGVILFDDVLPDQMEMLERDRRFNAWCGDVYKIVPILRRYRPDLSVSVFETFIGPYRKGLAVVSDLDPKSSVLAERYCEIEDGIKNDAFDVGSIVDLERTLLPRPISDLPRLRAPSDVKKNLAACLSRARPTEIVRGSDAPEAPKLSVVVVAFDMARELPRTLKTLSAEMQIGVSNAEYEVIVVDNGSQSPADHNACSGIARNARFINLPPGKVSPCHAVNVGIGAARAEWIGVLIDGARMASPGLLTGALRALGDDKAALAGSFGFHLGDEVQSVSVGKGYDQRAEDALLGASGWEEDGYRLFDISVFSKSSGKGWQSLPSESNAVFMHRDLWIALDGYDEGFRSAGGGLANLDFWKRVCERPGVKVRMVMGEGTFHQIHGGATTGVTVSKRPQFDREYEALRGEAYRRPDVPVEFVGEARQVSRAPA